MHFPSTPRGARHLLVLGAVVAASAVLGGVAQAEGALHVPGADGVIHSCYSSDDGRLRLIDPGMDSCRHEEAALQWNQTGPQGPAGPQGAKGDPGAQGPQGPAGSAGVSNYTIQTFDVALPDLTSGGATVYCPAGQRVIGGGVQDTTTLYGLNMLQSYPLADGTGWVASVYSNGSSVVTQNVRVYAICATVH